MHDASYIRFFFNTYKVCPRPEAKAATTPSRPLRHPPHQGRNPIHSARPRNSARSPPTAPADSERDPSPWSPPRCRLRRRRRPYATSWPGTVRRAYCLFGSGGCCCRMERWRIAAVIARAEWAPRAGTLPKRQAAKSRTWLKEVVGRSCGCGGGRWRERQKDGSSRCRG